MTNYEDLWDWCLTEVLKLPNGQDVWNQIQKCKSQRLSDARREERERCLEALPKKKSIVGIPTEPEGNLVQDMVNLRALSQVESFNEAIDQAISAITNHDKPL